MPGSSQFPSVAMRYASDKPAIRGWAAPVSHAGRSAPRCPSIPHSFGVSGAREPYPSRGALVLSSEKTRDFYRDGASDRPSVAL